MFHKNTTYLGIYETGFNKFLPNSVKLIKSTGHHYVTKYLRISQILKSTCDAKFKISPCKMS